MNAFFDWLALQIQRQPRTTRFGLSVLPKVLPRKWASKVVTSSDAVRETFARPEDFWMGYLNAPKLKLGPFLLGMDPPLPEYSQEKPLLVATLHNLPNEIARFATADAERAAKELARTLSHAGALELAAGYAEPVFVRALAHCFGVPAQGEPGGAFNRPTPANHQPLARYVRTFGATIGSEHPAPGGLESHVLTATPDFRAHIERAIRAHRDGTIAELLPKVPGAALAPEDTVLGQLIARAPFADGDAGSVRSVAGMMSASASFPNAFASVLHELLLRPRHLRGFAAAVRAHDEQRALGYVREALRFRPPFPMLVRTCPNKAKLRATDGEFDSGEIITFFPAAAMFDSARVERPEEFDPQRPESIYLLFGAAPRECIGKPLMLKLFLPLFDALFRHLPQVLKAAPGTFKYDGPVLDRYELELGALLGLPSIRPSETSEPSMPPASSAALGDTPDGSLAARSGGAHDARSAHDAPAVPPLPAACPHARQVTPSTVPEPAE